MRKIRENAGFAWTKWCPPYVKVEGRAARFARFPRSRHKRAGGAGEERNEEAVAAAGLEGEREYAMRAIIPSVPFRWPRSPGELSGSRPLG